MASKVPVGLQLFSVRHDCEKDGGKNFPNVVKTVANYGYTGVEFAGYYGWEARDIRKVLDDNNLACCGAHVGIQTLLGDELEKSVEFHRAIGNRFLIVPGLPKEYCDSIAAWAKTADLFNQIAEHLRPHGMYTGYHNHSHEFHAIKGQVPWDVFSSKTRKDVVMQLDIGNAIDGGADCAALLNKYPGRGLTIHIKEYGGPPEAVVGEGEVDWKALLPVLEAKSGAQWYIIEHERDPHRALADAGKCLVNFRRMLAEV